jgi:hypothetical protein
MEWHLCRLNWQVSKLVVPLFYNLLYETMVFAISHNYCSSQYYDSCRSNWLTPKLSWAKNWVKPSNFSSSNCWW